jgi:TFIIF-interacting CTD phosphatase-like protein
MRKLLVLDIDQTLIHARERRSSNKMHNFIIHMRGPNGVFYIFKRRGLDNFIANINKLQNIHGLKIAIWTAAERTYAVKILDNIWPGWQNDVLFLRHRLHCSLLPDGSYVKDLSKIPGGYDIMLVDDNIDNYRLNTELGFSVWKSSPYVAGSNDSELSDVYNHLRRFIDKRFPLKPKQFINRQKTNNNQSYYLKPIPKKKNL